MFEDQRCGQCKSDYTQKCKQIIKCQYHNGKCFACANCTSQIIINPKKCNKCQRVFAQSQLYYDHQCNQYFCRYEFLQAQQKPRGYFQIPCKSKHTQSITHLYSFIKDYCFWCGRKVQYKQKCSQDVIVCKMCLQISSYQSQKEYQCNYFPQKISQNITKNIQAQIQPKKPQQIIQIKNTGQSAEQLKAATQQKRGLEIQLYSSYAIIEVMKQDLRLSQQNRKVQYLSRMSVQKIVNNPEKTVHCSICLVDFHCTDKPPFMICLRQHLLCGACYPKQQNCPQCGLRIDKQNVLASRLKISFLQLQTVISKSFTQTVKHFKQKIQQVQKKSTIALVQISQIKQREEKIRKKQFELLDKQGQLLLRQQRLNQMEIIRPSIPQRGRPRGSGSKK